jgi:hypothetical protein
VLDISVSGGWNSAKIKKVFSDMEQKTGTKPQYVISDNDTKLKKSIREMDYCHVADIGHTLALAVEKVYKSQADFQALSKALSAVKIKEVMRPAGYLLPPRQRTIARFMNLSASIKWAIRMLRNYSKLTKEEQQVFRFVKTHRKLINELNKVLEHINAILKQVKNNGLSAKEAQKCIKMLQAKPGRSSRERKVIASIKKYLQQTSAKITTQDSVWHASSDIIESIFGTYKARKPKNPLYGITTNVLILPLLTKMDDNNKLTDFNCKQVLEGILLKDITAWKNTHLTENLVVKRQNKLAG